MNDREKGEWFIAMHHVRMLAEDANAEAVRLRAALKELIDPTVPPQLGDSVYNMVVPLAAWENAKSIVEQRTVSRCEVTGNPVGTDTWAVGRPCQCGPCQKMLSEQSAPTEGHSNAEYQRMRYKR